MKNHYKVVMPFSLCPNAVQYLHQGSYQVNVTLNPSNEESSPNFESKFSKAEGFLVSENQPERSLSFLFKYDPDKYTDSTP